MVISVKNPSLSESESLVILSPTKEVSLGQGCDRLKECSEGSIIATASALFSVEK